MQRVMVSVIHQLFVNSPESPSLSSFATTAFFEKLGYGLVKFNHKDVTVFVMPLGHLNDTISSCLDLV